MHHGNSLRHSWTNYCEKVAIEIFLSVHTITRKYRRKRRRIEKTDTLHRRISVKGLIRETVNKVTSRGNPQTETLFRRQTERVKMSILTENRKVRVDPQLATENENSRVAKRLKNSSSDSTYSPSSNFRYPNTEGRRRTVLKGASRIGE